MSQADQTVRHGVEPAGATTEDAGSPDLWTRLPEPLALVHAVPAALALTTAATLVCMMLGQAMPTHGYALVYLPLVLLSAAALGMTTGLATAVLAFLAYNFFFIHPRYTFDISDPSELWTLLAFFAVALMTGSLAGRMREVAVDARQRAAALHTLNEFAGQLSGATAEKTVADALVARAAATVGGAALVLLRSDRIDGLTIASAVPPGASLDSADWQAARNALRSGETAHAAAVGWPGARYEFRPLTSARGTIGLLGLSPARDSRTTAREYDATLETMIRHASIALERTRLGTENAAAREEAERERLRSALLSSLSHDLRTPLASILGAVTSLRELGDKMSEDTRADLLVAIEEETARLSLFVANLLDMTRLESGEPNLRRDWLDVADVANGAVARAKRLLPGRSISLRADDNLPLVRGDATLLEHVVLNLIDNAAKFSAPDQPIRLTVTASARQLRLCVDDEGRGIPADALPYVFHKFYRVPAHGRDVPGTGLGLAICHRIVEGMGGGIEAVSPGAGGRGTTIIVKLPVPKDRDDGSQSVSEERAR